MGLRKHAGQDPLRESIFWKCPLPFDSAQVPLNEMGETAPFISPLCYFFLHLGVGRELGDEGPVRGSPYHLPNKPSKTT